MKDGCPTRSERSSGKWAAASFEGWASASRSTTKPWSAKALTTAARGRRQNDWVTCTLALCPGVAHELGVEVAPRWGEAPGRRDGRGRARPSLPPATPRRATNDTNLEPRALRRRSDN